MKTAIPLLTNYLKENNYHIEINSHFLSVVKHSDDPWNHFNKFIAKEDGVYNYIEVQMSGYKLTKRLSCTNLETACFVTLALFCARTLALCESNPDDNVKMISGEIKKHIKHILSNTADYNAGQWIIDELIETAQ